MEIITLTDSRVFSSNCYIVISGDSFSVVDPSVSYRRALRSVPSLANYKPGYVLLTHGHFDHIREIESYVDAGCEVLVTEHDAALAADSALNCSAKFGERLAYSGEYRGIFDGERIRVGDAVFEVIETPGHTAGSVCYLTDGLLFTGDTLFANGGYGRCDVPSGDFDQLRSSLRKLFDFDEKLKVYSGHGPDTLLGLTKSFFG